MAVSVSEVVIVPDREELKVFLCTLWGFGQRFFEVEIASFRPRQARLVGGEGDIELVSANDDTMFGSRRLGLCSDSSCQVELAAGNCDVESPCLGYVIYEVIVRNGSGRFVLGEFSLSTVPRLHPVY